MNLNPPYVSALTAGVLMVMQMALLYAVTVVRRRDRQSLGDGGHHDLLMAVRRHGNLAENAGLFVAGFALLELVGGGGLGHAVLCAAFVLARIAHAIGLSMKNTVNPLRIGGTVVTVFVGTTLGARLMLAAVAHLPV
ncbi:MAG TPA: MAPEG family protein [Xanthobacteraceae bacterium]|nr:MAPEG family protein [Xanthobacteraceae bacterium]